MIKVVLPPREGFSPNKFGAISLSTLEFVKDSKFCEDISVIGSDACDQPFSNCYEYIPSKRTLLSSATGTYLRNIYKKLKTQDTKLVEIHNRPYYVSFFKKFTDCKVTLHYHNDPQEMKGSKTVRQRKFLLDNCEYIYCVSKYIRDRFVEGLDGLDLSKVITVYNSLPEQELNSDGPKRRKVIYVGRLSNDKGVLELVEAYRTLLPLHPNWEFFLIAKILGHPREFPYIKKIKTLESYPNFKFLYNIQHSETMQHFKEAAIAVLPSKWPEPFGRVVLESICMGCATVTSNSGGIPEIIGDAGVLLNRLTEESVTRAINNLITDETIRNWFQKAAVTRSRQFLKMAMSDNLMDDCRAKILAAL